MALTFKVDEDVDLGGGVVPVVQNAQQVPHHTTRPEGPASRCVTKHAPLKLKSSIFGQAGSGKVPLAECRALPELDWVRFPRYGSPQSSKSAGLLLEEQIWITKPSCGLLAVHCESKRCENRTERQADSRRVDPSFRRQFVKFSTEHQV